MPQRGYLNRLSPFYLAARRELMDHLWIICHLDCLDILPKWYQLGNPEFWIRYLKTYQCTMSLIDRYLSLTFATPDQLSLVAIAALSIAWDVVEDDPKYTVFGSLCAYNYFYYKLLKVLEYNSPSILRCIYTVA